MNDLQVQLFRLVSEGSVPQLNDFLNKNNNCSVDIRDEDQQTPLMIVASNGNETMVRFLLEQKNANPNLDDGDPNHKTALKYAARNRHTSIVNLFMQRLDLAQNDINQALIYYAEIGDEKGVQACLNRSANINADDLDDTALMRAIVNGHNDIAKKLLQLPNIEINAYNNMHEHALLLSLIYQRSELTELLLNRHDIDLHLQGYLASTALTYAIFRDQDTIADKLIEKEISKFGKVDLTLHPEALNWAVRKNKNKYVNLFLEQNADPNQPGDSQHIGRPDWVWRGTFETPYPIDQEERNGLPLIWAVHNKNTEMVKILLSYDANPEKENDKKETAELVAKDEEIPNEIQFLFYPKGHDSSKWKNFNEQQVISQKNSILSSSQPSIFSKTFVYVSSIIKGELLESFTEIILGELEELADMRDEQTKKLLVNALFEAKLTVSEMVKYASSLDPSIKERFSVVYCCLNPEKWEDPWMSQYKKSMLDSFIERSSSTKLQLSDYEKEVNWLKDYSKTLAKKFFDDREIKSLPLNEEELLEKKKFLENLSKQPNYSKSVSDDISELENFKKSLDEFIKTDGKTDIAGNILNNKTTILKKIEPSTLGNSKDFWKINLDHPNWNKIYNIIKNSPKGKSVRLEESMLPVVRAILFKLENNCRWSDLPQWLPPATKVKHYYYEWKNTEKLKQLIDIVYQNQNVNVPTKIS